MKLEYEQLLRMKEEIERVNKRRNNFNRIRAELWKIASDSNLSEETLIQKLLDHIGPAIGVSRACYNEYIEQDSKTSALVCTVEWVDTGVKPSLGTKIPGVLVKNFIDKNLFHFTPDMLAGLVSKPLSKVLTPIIYAITIPLDIRSLSVLPYSINRELKGWFTFDICHSNPHQPEMSEETQILMKEMVQIVTNHIEKHQVQLELKKAYDEMEQKVEKRTKQLQDTNTRLQYELNERLKAEQKLKEHTENLEETVQSKTRELFQLERNKMQLEKMAAVGQAASCIVYELRNPLASIKSGLTTLSSRITMEKENQQCLDVAKREALHMERMLKEMLNFTKPQQYYLHPQSVSEIVQRTLKRVTDRIQQTGITLINQIADDLPPLRLDVEKAGQLFYNLLDNALIAMPEGGTLTLTSQRSDSHVRLSIIDTGQGIHPDHIEHVFDPFYTGRIGGVGLGLTLAQRIVEEHGGAIHLESHWDHGTTVNVQFPLISKENETRTD